MKKYNIIKIFDNKSESTEDFVISETILTISINGNELASLVCSKENIENLIYGYLFTSGLINKVPDIDDLNIIHCEKDNKWFAAAKIDNENIKDYQKIQTSGCGNGKLLYKNDIKKQIITSDNTQIKSSDIFLLMKDFNNNSEIFIKTGGVHSAAIADTKKILCFREDIGRHNAIDKVAGELFFNNINLKDKILITSGRVPAEIIYKTIFAKIPIIISRSAPTGSAIELARKANITLIGFARGKKMNIYSGEERIIIS